MRLEKFLKKMLNQVVVIKDFIFVKKHPTVSSIIRSIQKIKLLKLLPLVMWIQMEQNLVQIKFRLCVKSLGMKCCIL